VQLALEADGEAGLADLVGHEAQRRVHRELDDLLGRVGRDLLDVHAALRGEHDRDPLGLTVEDQAGVQLLLDGDALLDQDLTDLLALGAGLRRLEHHADHLGRPIAGLLGAAHDLDAAALTAATSVDLGLDHHHAAALAAGEALGDLVRLLGVERHAGRGDGHAVALQDLFGLILVNLHEAPYARRLRGAGERGAFTVARGYAQR
jgi:hypothetical protein